MVLRRDLRSPAGRHRGAGHRPFAQVLPSGIVVSALLVLALAGLEIDGSGGTILTRVLLLHSPYEQDNSLPAPTAPDDDHILGTDYLGRDFLSRLLHGARVSLAVAVAAQSIALAIGIAVGAAAGYLRGAPDAFLMRTADVALGLPLPLVAMAVLAVLDAPGLSPVFLLLGLLGWGGIARVVRGEVRALRDREFAEAARALGADGTRIALRHLLPHATGPVLSLAALGIAGNILTEAWLSFLGIGAPAPLPSWGSMIGEARSYLVTQPRLCLLPGLAIMITVGGFQGLAEGLRKASDPSRTGRAGAAS